jgi:hypothetical protein
VLIAALSAVLGAMPEQCRHDLVPERGTIPRAAAITVLMVRVSPAHE